MSELNTTIDRESDDKDTSVWEYMIYVSLSIVLIIVVGKIVLNLGPERSEYFEIEKVANETYKQYSQRLDLISRNYAKELEKIKKEN
jgi:hypothetical protein